MPSSAPAVTLGLRANAGQFALLVGVSALVGGMVGQERAIVPLLGVEVFGLSTASAALAFLVAFGLTKAVTNLVAGALADRVGRKPVLVGRLAGRAARAVRADPGPGLGLGGRRERPAGGQPGADLVDDRADEDRPRRTAVRRGLALGLNEASGYVAVARHRRS